MKVAGRLTTKNQLTRSKMTSPASIQDAARFPSWSMPSCIHHDHYGIRRVSILSLFVGSKISQRIYCNLFGVATNESMLVKSHHQHAPTGPDTSPLLLLFCLLYNAHCNAK
uniref:Uncharacterized protein n=1 Tax=Entomoneis paludosa TaxID=265537 RepID=A0A7S2Y2U2_9STRA